VPFASRTRASHRTISDVWMRLAGELAVVADLSTQGAAAARRHDGPALASLIDRLRVAILDAIKLHSTKHEYLDDEAQS
jgi:hypothetical protein